MKNEWQIGVNKLPYYKSNVCEILFSIHDYIYSGEICWEVWVSFKSKKFPRLVGEPEAITEENLVRKFLIEFPTPQDFFDVAKSTFNWDLQY